MTTTTESPINRVANQLPRHPGATCQELFRLYLDEFANIGMERGAACLSLKKRFQQLEDQGLVLGESGKAKTDPTRWTWVGPAPSTDTEAEAETDDDEALRNPEFTPGVIVTGRGAHVQLTAAPFDDVGVLEPLAPVHATGTPEPAHPSAPGNGHYLLDDDDPLDSVLIELRRQFRARPRRIERAEHKTEVLERLSGMLSPDISSVLNEIIEDLAP